MSEVSSHELEGELEESEGEDEEFEEFENLLMENENSDVLLNIFSKLYMIDFGGKISLPKIVVLGDQSAGKSSVVESLSGVNLPRGSGIVTRCPIIVQMIRKREKYIVFEGKRVNNRQLCALILEKQNELAGDRKGISNKPIKIQIYSPRVFDLTIIDLPGLVINPVDGQPENIKEMVDELVVSYIKNEECVILSIIQATQDIATVRSISFSQKYDPEGERTLGVLTKTDAALEKSNVTDVLDMKRISLNLGVFATRNRTPKELQSNVSLQEARKIEEDFFKKEYPGYIKFCGMKVLALEMSNLLRERIEKCYPRLLEEMDRKLRKSESELDRLGPGVPDEDYEKRILLLNMVQKISKKVVGRLSVGGDCRTTTTTSSSSSINNNKNNSKGVQLFETEIV